MEEEKKLVDTDVNPIWLKQRAPPAAGGLCIKWTAVITRAGRGSASECPITGRFASGLVQCRRLMPPTRQEPRDDL